MENLRNRLISHARKIEKIEEMEAISAGVFTREFHTGREKFAALVQKIVKPAFDEFKLAMRQVGRDAVIISNLTHDPVQSITLKLIDRHLTFGVGKTVKLVNPTDDIAKVPNTKFYEVQRSEDLICIRQRADLQIEPISTMVSCAVVCPKFMENELASFFERAYPITS